MANLLPMHQHVHREGSLPCHLVTCDVYRIQAAERLRRVADYLQHQDELWKAEPIAFFTDDGTIPVRDWLRNYADWLTT